MIKHYITKYSTDDGKRYATAWLQLNLFSRSYCFNVKSIELS